MGYATILGLDLGKFKSVCCVMDVGTGVVNRRTRSRNAIRSIYLQQGLTLARGNKQWTRAGRFG
jgi:hypothetical protein